MWFIGVEIEQETSAPPPKKNPGSAPDTWPSFRYSIDFSASKTFLVKEPASIGRE